MHNLLEILIFTLRNFTKLPILRYLGICNVLHIWHIRAIPTYRVYRLYDIHWTGAGSIAIHPLFRDCPLHDGRFTIFAIKDWLASAVLHCICISSCCCLQTSSEQFCCLIIVSMKSILKHACIYYSYTKRTCPKSLWKS